MVSKPDIAFLLFFSGAGVEWSALHIAMQGYALLSMIALIIGGSIMFSAVILLVRKQ